jgi:hypothetical protein
MNFQELPNLIWGGIFGVWVSLIFATSFIKLDIRALFYSIGFFVAILIVVNCLSIGIETHRYIYHVVTILATFLLSGFVYFYCYSIVPEYMSKLDFEKSLAQILLIPLIVILWIISIEYSHQEYSRRSEWYRE